MTSPENKALELFLQKAKVKRNNDKVKKEMEERIKKEKHIKLKPIRKLLQSFIDIKLQVQPTEIYSKHMIHHTKENLEPILFDVYVNDSSPSWAPGVSIYFDDPAEVEIAIPNQSQIDDQGIVIMRCSTLHPEAALLNGKVFRTMDEACMALSNFLLSSMVDVNMPAENALKLSKEE